MEIISKKLEEVEVIKGQYSNGSDWETITEIIFKVIVKDGYKTFEIRFDHEATDEEINSKFESKDFVDVTTEIDQIQYILNTLPLDVIIEEQVKIRMGENYQVMQDMMSLLKESGVI